MKYAVLLFALACIITCAPSYADDIAVANSSGVISIADRTTLETRVSRSGFGTVTALGVQAVSGNIVIGNAEGNLYLVKCSDLSEITHRSGLGNIKDLGVRSDGGIVIGTTGGSIFRVDASTLATIATGSANYGAITSIAIMKGSDRGTDVTDRVAVGNIAGAVYLLDGVTLGGYAWGPDWGYVRGMAATPNGNIAFGTDGGVFIRTGRDFDGVAADYGYGTIYDVAVRPTGEAVIASSPYNGIVWLRSGSNLQAIASNPGCGNMTALGVQKDGDIVFGTSNGSIAILDGASPMLLGKVVKTGLGSITALAVLADVSSVKGKITLSDYPAVDYWRTPVGIEFIQSGSVIHREAVVLDANGGFTTSYVPAGVYDLSFKASHFLRRILHGISVNGLTTLDPITLINGDLDGDNVISDADVSMTIRELE